MDGYKQQYEKLLREYNLVKTMLRTSYVMEDALKSYFITAFHLKDFLKEDQTVTIPGREIENLIDNNACLSLAADIANKSKHLKLRKKNRRDGTLTCTCYTTDKEYGGFGVFEIVDNTASSYDIESSIDDIKNTWETFLRSHGLI